MVSIWFLRVHKLIEKENKLVGFKSDFLSDLRLKEICGQTIQLKWNKGSSQIVECTKQELWIAGVTKRPQTQNLTKSSSDWAFAALSSCLDLLDLTWALKLLTSSMRWVIRPNLVRKSGTLSSAIDKHIRSVWKWTRPVSSFKNPLQQYKRGSLTWPTLRWLTGYFEEDWPHIEDDRPSYDT